MLIGIEKRKSKFVTEKRDDNTKIYRQKLRLSLESMFKYMEAMSVLTPGGELDNMIKEINASIQKLDFAIKMRSTHKSEELEQN